MTTTSPSLTPVLSYHVWHDPLLEEWMACAHEDWNDALAAQLAQAHAKVTVVLATSIVDAIAKVKPPLANDDEKDNHLVVPLIPSRPTHH